MAEISGKLVLDDGGSLRMEEHPGHIDTVPIWPAGFELDTSGDEASVLDEEGRVAARVGEKVYMGGGGIPEDQVTLADERMLRELFERCPGEYWIVGSEVKALQQQGRGKKPRRLTRQSYSWACGSIFARPDHRPLPGSGESLLREDCGYGYNKAGLSEERGPEGSEMGEQGVPDLEEMDEQEARRFLIELLPRFSPEEEYEIRHEDYVMEMPQSGERIRGRQKMREFQEAYPSPPTMQLRRVIVRGGLWVVEIHSDYGGRVYDVVLILELRAGKIYRDTRYYAEPFEAPEWRARWVERIER